MRRSPDNSQGTAVIGDTTEAIDEDDNRGSNRTGPPPASAKSLPHMTVVWPVPARWRCCDGDGQHHTAKSRRYGRGHATAARRPDPVQLHGATGQVLPDDLLNAAASQPLSPAASRQPPAWKGICTDRPAGAGTSKRMSRRDRVINPKVPGSRPGRPTRSEGINESVAPPQLSWSQHQTQLLDWLEARGRIRGGQHQAAPRGRPAAAPPARRAGWAFGPAAARAPSVREVPIAGSQWHARTTDLR